MKNIFSSFTDKCFVHDKGVSQHLYANAQERRERCNSNFYTSF